MKKIGRLMEWFWLIVAIIGLVMALRVINAVGITEGATWLLFPVVAAGLYFFRRFTNRRLERMDKEHQQRKAGH